jgi:hypothetical protein
MKLPTFVPVTHVRERDRAPVHARDRPRHSGETADRPQQPTPSPTM